MLKGFSALVIRLNQHRLLLGMLAASLLLHSLLLAPGWHWPQAQPQPVVILAKIRSPEPQAPVRHDTAASQTAAVTNQPLPPVSSVPEPQPEPRLTTNAASVPVPPAPRRARAEQAAQSPQKSNSTTASALAAPPDGEQPNSRPGLTFSKEEQASDPLEYSYQQQLLAHLRQRLRAPAGLKGSVRLEIQFSYRQLATHIQVIHSSGNPKLDDWAMKAVMAANPFPPVPAELPANYIFRPTIKTEE
ncbi:TonB family protein [Venatoribacter cucullus]|uniref:TonB family protein n=1 Tax=Venatoribacter cucullus TaxID=2661630 RepID=UPI00223EDD0D|nr:TonB family protein [Venatoribacter cucullus]UZK04262.1 TonB family protein [Venatoribacter cucullus]